MNSRGESTFPKHVCFPILILGSIKFIFCRQREHSHIYHDVAVYIRMYIFVYLNFLYYIKIMFQVIVRREEMY